MFLTVYVFIFLSSQCSLDSKRQSDDNLEFITSHPLMDQAVPSYGDPYPIFDLTRADYRLTQIAVYKQEGKDGILYNIIYLGTGTNHKQVLLNFTTRNRKKKLSCRYVLHRVVVFKVSWGVARII